MTEPDQQRYNRHIALFGAEGQARIAATIATIAGLGGLGCHVAQQLAMHLTSFVLSASLGAFFLWDVYLA